MHYNKYVGEDSITTGGGFGYGGGAGIILLFVFLLILFAVFRGGFGGHDGGHMCHEGGYGHGGGYGRPTIADFEAIAQNNQRVPVEQVQLAKDFGALKEKITLGNFELSRQMSETAAAAELRACMEREADMRAQIAELKSEVMNQKTLAIVSDKFCRTDAMIQDVLCNMERKQVARPLVGIPDLACTNIPNRGFFGDDRRGGFGCGC